MDHVLHTLRSENKEYMTSLGFIITGFLMLAVAGLCITPSTMSVDNMNAFRMFGGAALLGDDDTGEDYRRPQAMHEAPRDHDS